MTASLESIRQQRSEVMQAFAQGMMTATPAEPGCWLIRLVKGGPYVAARIWRAETVVDPDFPQNRMDGTRSPFLAAEIDGEVVDIAKVWGARRDRVITEEEYRYRIADSAWARQHSPAEAIATPRKPVDWLQGRIPF